MERYSEEWERENKARAGIKGYTMWNCNKQCACLFYSSFSQKTGKIGLCNQCDMVGKLRHTNRYCTHSMISLHFQFTLIHLTYTEHFSFHHSNPISPYRGIHGKVAFIVGTARFWNVDVFEHFSREVFANECACVWL